MTQQIHSYLVTYYYLASGMEGRADTRDYGFVRAYTPQEACDTIVERELGNRHSQSDKDWFRGCLSATLVQP